MSRLTVANWVLCTICPLVFCYSLIQGCPKPTDISVLFFKNLFLNVTILYWFCHISTWIHHRYTRVPHPEPSSLLSRRTIPLDRPSAPAPSIQYCASNLDCGLVSYMILYMFQCHSTKSSHPPCPVLTVASWPAYRFLKRQVRRSGILISFRIFHSLLWSTQSKALA